MIFIYFSVHFYFDRIIIIDLFIIIFNFIKILINDFINFYFTRIQYSYISVRIGGQPSFLNIL